jgi:hypothetical protein
MSLFGLISRQIDIVTAFLNAELGAHEEVYVRPPPPVILPSGHVWKLLKALYGLVQAPNAWFQQLRRELIRFGFRVSPFNPCVYINETSKLIISVWVDNLRIYGSTDADINQFLEQLASVFQFTNEDADSTYLGMNIQMGNDQVTINQHAYARKILDRFNVQNTPPARTPIHPDAALAKSNAPVNEAIRPLYLKRFGSANYLPTMTRPDLAYALSMCGRYNANPQQPHMDTMNRVYAYIKDTPNLGITYRKTKQAELIGYVDASWRNCPDTRRSTTGWVFELAGGAISWASRRQDTIADSTTEAEYVAASDACKEAIWLKRFINDLQIPGLHFDKIPLHIDNRSAIRLVHNPEMHRRTKHIDAKHHFIREAVEEGHVTIEWIGTKDNKADVFTKALGRYAFELQRDRIIGI